MLNKQGRQEASAGRSRGKKINKGGEKTEIVSMEVEPGAQEQIQQLAQANAQLQTQLQQQQQQHELHIQVQLLQHQLQQLQQAVPQAAVANGVMEPKPPAFSGDGKGLDVETWLFKLSNHFAAYPAAEERQLAKAATALEGAAGRWWRLETSNGETQFSWQEFKTKILEGFKPVNAEQRAKDSIASMRQTGSAKAYADRFRSAILDIPAMTEAWKLGAFTRGLKPNVRRELERYPPVSLSEAIRIAERIDAIDFKFSRGAGQHGEPHQPGAVTEQMEGPVPMELGNLQRDSPRNAAAQRIAGQDHHRCYNCNRPGHRIYDCSRQPRCFNCKELGHTRFQCTRGRVRSQ